ncbi:MAG: TetR/AcrR family transcriptional regulator [Caulobacteraceae bacterium]
MNAKPRIDAAAIELFTRVGVDAATTKELAALAGISEGAIYRHYKSKDELAISLFMGAHQRLSSLVEEAARSSENVRQQADAIVRAYCQAADEDWALFSFHTLTMHRFLPYYQEDGLDPVSMVEKVLKQAMITAQIPAADPAVLASMCIGVITQTAQNRIYRRFETPLSAHADLMSKGVQALLFAR